VGARRRRRARALALERPILVGWSYGGYVICDYLRKFGDRDLGGIVFVAAAPCSARRRSAG
jgi:pimeloyl-ACP methyl ester carboxylesterase